MFSLNIVIHVLRSPCILYFTVMFGFNFLNAQEISIFDIARNGTLKQLKLAVSKDENSINTINKSTLNTCVDSNDKIFYTRHPYLTNSNTGGSLNPLIYRGKIESEKKKIIEMNKNNNSLFKDISELYIPEDSSDIKN